MKTIWSRATTTQRGKQTARPCKCLEELTVTTRRGRHLRTLKGCWPLVLIMNNRAEQHWTSCWQLKIAQTLTSICEKLATHSWNCKLVLGSWTSCVGLACRWGVEWLSGGGAEGLQCCLHCLQNASSKLCRVAAAKVKRTTKWNLFWLPTSPSDVFVAAVVFNKLNKFAICCCNQRGTAAVVDTEIATPLTCKSAARQHMAYT